MEIIINTLVLLFGVIRGCFTRLTVQEWGYLLGVLCAALRGFMIWWDNRIEQRKRTAILQHYSRSAQPTYFQMQQKLEQFEQPQDKAGK